MRIGIIGLVVITIGVATFLTIKNTPTSPTFPYLSENQIDESKAVSYWSEVITQEGPEEAHKQMVHQGNTLSLHVQHELAHTFGKALYETRGLEGLSYCGQGEFLYGCYHQFLDLVMAQHGMGIFPELKNICDNSGKNSMTCTHGLGHGLQSAHGYNVSALTNALEKCREFYEAGEYRQICADGVFMEYNLHTVTMGSGRPFEQNRAFEPCLSIDPEFRDQCVFELPLWWYYSLPKHASTEELLREIGSLCRNAPALASSTVCFTGMGFPASIAKLTDRAGIGTLCGNTTITEEEKMLCIRGANICFYKEPVRTFLERE